MAKLDIIEFFDESGEIIVCKQPTEGSGAYRMGTQLVVQESQVAVFYRDGQALDGFQPGRHTLSTQNLPMLVRVLGAGFKKRTPFRSYVYFVATKTFIDLGWGTSSPVVFRDTDFRMISLRAHGSYAIRVAKPRTFLNNLVGTRGLETTFAVEDYLRTIIVSRLNETLAAKLTSILDLPAMYNEIALDVKRRVEVDFEQYGLQLVDLFVQAITPPPEVREMINRASGMAVQDVERYQAISAADAMRDAANNPGGAGEGIGAGLGVGLGMSMANRMGGAAAGPPPDPKNGDGQTPSAPEKLSVEELKTRLADLKRLEDEGLISSNDFEEQKRRLLSQL